MAIILDVDEDSLSDIPDDEIDEELGLPAVLAHVSSDEKRKLLIFKRTHNERDWEEEILRRQDLMTKKIDLERLKRMQSVSTSREVPSKKPRGKAKAMPKKIAISDSESEDLPQRHSEDESSSMDEDDERPTSNRRVAESSSDDEDLFSSDEEEALTSKYKQNKAAAPKSIQDKSSLIDWGESSSESERESDRGGDYAGRAGITSASNEGREADTAPPSADDVEAELKHYHTIQLRRIMMERCVREPYFETAIMNGFVRVFLGSRDGVEIYRMGVVAGVEQGGRKYRLSDNSASTNKRLVVDIAGNQKHNIKLTLISNSKISQAELDVYLNHIKATRTLKPLTVRQVKERRQDLIRELRHQYTHEEISDMVLKNRGLNKAVVTEYSTALSSLNKRRAKALANDDIDELDKVDKAIEKLEHEIRMEKEIVEKSSSFQYVSLNRRNKEANFQKDLTAGVKKRKLEQIAAVEGPAALSHDPFVRRETFGQNLWKTGARLELEKAKLERDEVLAEVKKLKGQGQTGGAVAELEARAAALASKLESQGAIDGKAVQSAAKASSAKTSSSARSSNVARDSEENWKFGKVSFDEIRRKVSRRLGVDPYEISRLSTRDRYLLRTSAALPPPGPQRELQRRGLSLSVVIGKLMEAREQDTDN